jgi:hypothetical protein
VIEIETVIRLTRHLMLDFDLDWTPFFTIIGLLVKFGANIEHNSPTDFLSKKNSPTDYAYLHVRIAILLDELRSS